VSETFAATGGQVGFQLSSDGSVSAPTGSAAGFGDGLSLSFDAGTGAYTVRNAGGVTTTFLPTTETPVNPAEPTPPTRAFTKQNGNVADTLILFRTGAENSTLALTYASYGAWQRLTGNDTSADVSTQYFVYGVRQPADRPSTGSASYTTIVDGTWVNASGVYNLGGTSSFTADFSSLTVATSLNLVGTRANGSGTLALGQFNGSGTIAAMGGAFSGTLAHQGTADDGAVYSGGFAGAFFGPQGQEVGYTFSLTSPSGGAAGGAVVGKGN